MELQIIHDKELIMVKLWDDVIDEKTDENSVCFFVSIENAKILAESLMSERKKVFLENITIGGSE